MGLNKNVSEVHTLSLQYVNVSEYTGEPEKVLVFKIGSHRIFYNKQFYPVFTVSKKLAYFKFICSVADAPEAREGAVNPEIEARRYTLRYKKVPLAFSLFD